MQIDMKVTTFKEFSIILIIKYFPTEGLSMS